MKIAYDYRFPINLPQALVGQNNVWTAHLENDTPLDPRAIAQACNDAVELKGLDGAQDIAAYLFGRFEWPIRLTMSGQAFGVIASIVLER